MLNDPEVDCVLKYSLDSCCSVNKVCGKESDLDLWNARVSFNVNFQVLKVDDCHSVISEARRTITVKSLFRKIPMQRVTIAYATKISTIQRQLMKIRVVKKSNVACSYGISMS